MDKQMSLSAFNDELAQVRTKKKEFMEQMDRIIPWDEWIALIQPCYYKGERGNKPYTLELMLRLFILQNLYDLSDEGTVAEVIDSRAFSDFCGVDSSNQVPNGDTLGRFRNLLIGNGLQEKLFAQVVAMLMERGLILKKGTIVDSTIISAPSSTKNKEKKRDPDARQTKKGNTWHFGYKAHIGVDRDSKSGQYKAKKREHAKSSVRAKVEHVFGVVKGLLKFKKTRYRGLRKQEAKFNIVFALANLILADRPCLAV